MFSPQSLSTQLTRIFTQSDQEEVVNDFACYVICESLKVASVSILLYQGNRDRLVCKGRYVDPKYSDLKIEDNRKVLDYVFHNMPVCGFIHAQRDRDSYQEVKKNFTKYKDYFSNGTVSEANFMEVYQNYTNWQSSYLQIKQVYNKESYKICYKDQEDATISGGYFCELIHDKLNTIKVQDLVADSVNVDNNSCIHLLREHLEVIIDDDLYYVGVPLRSRDRYFGVLRILVGKKENTIIEDNLIKPIYKERLAYISNIIALHLENNANSDSYKKLAYSSVSDYISKSQDVEDYLEKQCVLLSKLVNCRGAIARITYNKISPTDAEQKFRICSSGLKNYNEQVLAIQLQKQLPHAHKHFPQDDQVIAILIEDCFDYPFKAKFYFLTESTKTTSRVRCESHEWGFPNVLESQSYFQLLKDENIKEVLIFRIPNHPDGYFTFYNSSNRSFNQHDVEMLYMGVKKIGYELQNHFSHRKQRQMDIVTQMHEKLNQLIEREKKNTGTTEDIRNKYLKRFYNLLRETLDKLELFEKIVIWECVSEIVPKRQAVRRFIFRTVDGKDFRQLKHFKMQQPVASVGEKYYVIEKSTLTVKEHLIDYKELKQLNKFLDLNLKSEYDFFDIPVFVSSNLEDRFPLNSLMTIIYHREENTAKHDNYIGSEDFVQFVRFLTQQITIAWANLLDGISDGIKSKIDLQLNLHKERGITSTEEQLTTICKILATEFKCDLCSFLLLTNDRTNLKYIASNIRNLKSITYNTKENRGSLSVQSFNNLKNYRLVGRSSVAKHTNYSRLNKVEKNYDKTSENKYGVGVEHWLSVVIKLNPQRALGLIKMYQMTERSQLTEKQTRIVSKPFSELDTNLLRNLQNSLFHIIEDHILIGERDRVMGTVLHQVISPLTALIRHSDNIRKGIFLNDEEKVRVRLGYIQFMAKQAASHARSYRALLDSQRGTFKVRLKYIKDLRKKLVAKSIDYKPLARFARDVGIHVSDGIDKISIETDTVLFDQIINNLLDNAIKYTLTKYERRELLNKNSNVRFNEDITVEVNTLLDRVAIIITNIGVSIKKEERHRIFEQYYRSTNAKNYSFVGEGIGLFLSQNIIKALKGELVLLETEHPNIISFKITLPR